MAEIHTILGGKVRIYRRETGNNWYCSTYMIGKERRKSTKEGSLAKAKNLRKIGIWRSGVSREPENY